jgi:SNF2 family DNA or RNA helicase
VTEVAVYSEALIDELKSKSGVEQNRVLFLEQHPEYPTHYLVNSFDPLYPHKLKELIGPYRAVSMFKLDMFKAKADEEGYEKIVFLNDPKPVIDRIDSLTEPYPYGLEGIELRPFQLQGFNYLKDNPADIVNWSTGAGKSVFAVAKAKYLLKLGLVDKVVVVSREHNKINWQRTLNDIGSITATIPEGIASEASERRSKRLAQYKTSQVFIINYEKFRTRGKPAKGQTRESAGDGEELLSVLKNKRVYFIWDEMPTKLKNPSTATYKGAIKCVKATKEAYQSALTATPLENAPEDVYAFVKILTCKLENKVFTNLTDFKKTYAKSMNPWARWQVATWDMEKLQEMGMRLAHMTHQADKYRDPEIRAQFPKEHWEDIIIDMSEQDKALYKSVLKDIKTEYNMQDEILSKLLVLQLICNNPATLTIAQSELARAIAEKKKPTDRYCAKLDTLRELLGQIGGKVVLFTMYNDLGAKLLAKYVGDWGFTYVLFDGNAKKKQEALDRFKSDRRIKVFISSDQGSDSINLEEATTVINYDLPWKNSTLVQRVNRINRITSEAEHIFYYNLIVANSMEERKVKILTKKRGWQDAIFGGEISDQTDEMGRLGQHDLWYILTGEEL